MLMRRTTGQSFPLFKGVSTQACQEGILSGSKSLSRDATVGMYEVMLRK